MQSIELHQTIDSKSLSGYRLFLPGTISTCCPYWKGCDGDGDDDIHGPEGFRATVKFRTVQTFGFRGSDQFSQPHDKWTAAQKPPAISLTDG